MASQVRDLPSTCTCRVIALDPSVRGADGAVLTALIEIPNEELAPGPRGYRVQVIDYDASNRILYRPAPYKAGDLLKPEEIDALLARRQAADMAPTCPHGRPTSLVLQKADLEKQFGRDYASRPSRTEGEPLPF